MFEDILRFFKFLFDPPKAVIQVKNGQAVVAKGTIAKRALPEFSQFFADNNIQSTTIYVVKSELGDRLEFPSSFPENLQQRFRNLWNSAQ